MEYVTQGEPAQGRVLALYFTISGSETDSSFVVWCAFFVVIQSGIVLELFYVIDYLKTDLVLYKCSFPFSSGLLLMTCFQLIDTF